MVPDSLQKLIEDGVIDDVKTQLMSGKEAAVYVVERHGELLAAKVYKSREQRTFKATSTYTEGRNQTRNTRDKRAMGKRTAWGKELIESSWRDMEYQALFQAFHAGVRVPEPVLLYDDVLLMQLLVDDNGIPAPRLADFDLPAEVAELLHREIYGQVRLLLQCGKIHGDLSAFNILIAAGGPTIIDMPQVVDASGNNQAAEILRRDLANVTEHLARFDARLLRFRDCGLVLWQHYQRGTLHLAIDPEEGSARSASPGGGRRVRDAERGRMGRGAGRASSGPPRDPRGPPPDLRPPAQRPDQGSEARTVRPADAQRRPEPRPARDPQPRRAPDHRSGGDDRPDLRRPPRDDRPDSRKPTVNDDRPDLRKPPVHDDRPDLRKPPVNGDRPDRSRPPTHDNRPDLRKPPVNDNRPDLRRPTVNDDRPDLRRPTVSDHRPDLRRPDLRRPDAQRRPEPEIQRRPLQQTPRRPDEGRSDGPADAAPADAPPRGRAR